MHARLKVTIPRENARGDDLVGENCLLKFGVKRSGVADASGATEADNLKTERVEVRL